MNVEEKLKLGLLKPTQPSTLSGTVNVRCKGRFVFSLCPPDVDVWFGSVSSRNMDSWAIFSQWFLNRIWFADKINEDILDHSKHAIAISVKVNMAAADILKFCKCLSAEWYMTWNQNYQSPCQF